MNSKINENDSKTKVQELQTTMPSSLSLALNDLQINKTTTIITTTQSLQTETTEKLNEKLKLRNNRHRLDINTTTIQSSNFIIHLTLTFNF